MILTSAQTKHLRTMTARAVMGGRVAEYLAELNDDIRTAWLDDIRARAQVTRDSMPKAAHYWQWSTGRGGYVSLVYVVLKVLDDEQLGLSLNDAWFKSMD